MSDRRRRGRRSGGRRLPYKEIGDLRGALRSIYLSAEITHIHPDQRRILTIVAAVLTSLSAIGAFKLHQSYAHCAAIVDQRFDQRRSQHRAGVYVALRCVSVGQQISHAELREGL